MGWSPEQIAGRTELGGSGQTISDLMATEIAKVRSDIYDVSPSFSLYATSAVVKYPWPS